MTQDGMNRVKVKLLELMDVIKEEAADQSQEIRIDLLKTIIVLKQVLEEKWHGVEEQSKGTIGDVSEKVQENLSDTIKELEHKALKVQYTIREKYSKGMEKKDEVVVKTADALIDAVNKMKKALIKDE